MKPPGEILEESLFVGWITSYRRPSTEINDQIILLPNVLGSQWIPRIGGLGAGPETRSDTGSERALDVDPDPDLQRSVIGANVEQIVAPGARQGWAIKSSGVTHAGSYEFSRDEFESGTPSLETDRVLDAFTQ